MSRPLESTNDFVVKFANVNGSGSASANRLFAKSILRMGVPISSRNIFPSNIQGLPTWYEVRVSAAGYLGRRGGVDLMVAMNPQTWDKDVASVEPGGYLLYDSTKPIPPARLRDDINVVGVPLTEICNREYSDPRQRQLFKNIMYVGALSALLDMDVAEIERLIGEQFKGRDELISANTSALQIGRDHVLRQMKCPLGLRLEHAEASVTGSSSTATAQPLSVASMAAPPSPPGIRSRLRPPWPKPSCASAGAIAPIRYPARIASASSRRRTRWRPSAWSSAPPGTGRVPLPLPPGRAFRSCRNSSGWPISRRYPPSSSTSSAAAPRPACRPARSNRTSWPAPMPRMATRSMSC